MWNDYGLYLLMESDVFKSIVIQHFVIRIIPHSNHLRESVERDVLCFDDDDTLIPLRCFDTLLYAPVSEGFHKMLYNLHLFSYQMCMCGAHVWRSGQFEGVTLFLSPCGFWALTCETWRQAPLSIEPSCRPQSLKVCFEMQYHFSQSWNVSLDGSSFSPLSWNFC